MVDINAAKSKHKSGKNDVGTATVFSRAHAPDARIKRSPRIPAYKQKGDPKRIAFPYTVDRR